jgi:hypothetical protein
MPSKTSSSALHVSDDDAARRRAGRRIGRGGADAMLFRPSPLSIQQAREVRHVGQYNPLLALNFAS